MMLFIFFLACDIIIIENTKGDFVLTYYLAIDIGASSGRHILGHIEDGRLITEEIYRFENGIQKSGSSLTWDVERLYSEVKQGISECHRLGKIPKTIAIDTWGVDYVLLDEKEQEILPCISYRDPRTEIGAAEVQRIISQDELYSLTGIQKQNFNTIYQLYCDKQSGKLDRAKHFLMIPDYLSYKLTGNIKNEYTNATTTNLINASTKCWDNEIISRLGIPSDIFSPPSLPCDTVGELSEAVASDVGFNATVVLCPSHDTASAVASCPIDNDSVYISSGTWSLIGTENIAPCLSSAALNANFTNEGGIEYRFRFLKNIMGMWLFQCVRRDIGKTLTYDEMMKLAMESDFSELIDPNDPRFVAPENMVEEIRAALGMPDLPLSDVLSSIYHSLATSYKKAIDEIEHISEKEITSIYIVGGGSRDNYLNTLTSRYTGKRVYTGLREGTAIGNLISQIMRDRSIGLTEARKIIKNTFEIKEFN